MLEIKEEEKQNNHVTLDKMELTESDNKYNLLQDKKDTESLESIQNYAQRIKSFLGWQLNEQEFEYEPPNGLKTESFGDGNVTQNGSSSPEDEESIDKEKYLPVQNVDSLVIEENLKQERENKMEYIANYNKSNNVLESENTDNLIEKNEGNIISKEHEDKKDYYATPENKDVEMDFENNNVINIPSERKENLPINENMEMDSVNINNDFVDCSDTDTSVTEHDSINKESPCESKISESVSESTKDSFLDASKENNENEKSCLILGEITSSLSETEVDMLENKKNDRENEGKDFTENFTKSIRNEENGAKDDLRSEDSLDLDENLPLKNILPDHVKEIRRLSKDIVRDIIESARNSVHEFHANKAEYLHTTPLPGNLINNDLVKNHQEFCFNSEKENLSNVYEKFSKENIDNNLDHAIDRKENEQDAEDEETTCGFGCFKPKWIQKYATPRAYLYLFSIIGVIHGCYYTYVVSILSTLEKRYAFKTKVSGTLLLADEITPLVLGIVVGYIGGKTHRPRMVAIGMFMSAACCFVSGLPYLIYGVQKHSSYIDDQYETGPNYCKIGTNATECNIDEQPPTLSVVGIFLLASFLKGFATLSYYVIGMSYMDDIIKRKNSSMYFAIALALRLLGPLVGFLMSSGFLKYYENPLYDPGFGPDDPRWIGAWWIGFFLQGILLVIFTIPIALFPRRLPGQKTIVKDVSTASEDGLKEIFRGLLSALKRLGKNGVFIVLIINMTMKVFGHFGHSIMLPKYMENQFRLSASEASLYSGAVSIVCIIISTILGGFLIWKFRPRIKLLLSGMIASEIILAVGFLLLMIPRCQTPEMSHFGMNEDGLVLNSICNSNCDCSTSSFTPFCGPDGKTLYFSPCYAGCTEETIASNSSKTNKVFSNCSCVIQNELGATISEGFCPDENCRSQMIIYLIILFVLVTVSNLFTVANTMILLRCVHPSDKSIALGTFETFICLFGFIPFPVSYGALVDSACLVWEKSCGETGNCWFYDMDKYTNLIHGVSALFSSFSVVCLIALYFLSDRIRDLYKEENEEEESKYVGIKLDTVSGSVTKL